MPVCTTVIELCSSTNRGTQADIMRLFWFSFVFEEQHPSDPKPFLWLKIDQK